MSIDSATDNVNMEVEELEDNEAEEEEDKEEEEEEEEEEEDIDFNPFIRENSPEASSSLSSDNECVHDTPFKAPDETHNCEEEEEIIVQSSVNTDNNVTSPMQVDEEPRTKPNSSVEISKEEVDAISRRTRARHSLANYTLEELETFLQESDDERDLPNVDDQEEYRKFLAAVLIEEGDAEREGKVNENVDEDEDNDADFELELEEALMDSDVDENLECNNEEDAKRVTRQKNTKNSNNNKDKSTLLSQAMVPWRPILPYGYTPPQDSHIQLPNPQVYQNMMQPVYGFAPKQIGQLHCLIHEHVQLLIQIYSVCVLDITKKDIACEYQRMILEIMSKREETLVVQKVAYPDYLFKHPNVYPSYHDSNSLNWTPQINSPVLSVLDVAPLRLAKEFMDDVNSVLDQGKICLDAYKTYLRAPLFSLSQNDASLNTSDNSSNPAESKKSLASMLIDRTKKQSVALVPINIVRLAQVFYPLFNAAFFPYKPPPQAVVKRILFTESEDGLLAMGYMQYNHDWKAIRQRFLPCKTENQIFIRHKNRLSSNAPDNPIKEIRCIKTSPLTPAEKASISEALKLLKHDWMAVWKYVVPHKDPALLPRLWRIANGTQKSYKKSEHAKAKRRLYDIKRRKLKASMPDCQIAQGKKNGNQVDKGDNSAGDVDGEDETYVHEAFLADSASKHANKNNTQSVDMSPSNGNPTKQNTSTVKASTQKKPSGNLVRLAPNLPPINLPPSVTVIRKADIDNNIADKTPNIAQPERVGSFLSNSWHNLNIGNVNVNANASQPGAEENTNDSFLMHPLLFQNPEINRASYFPNNFPLGNPNQSNPAMPTAQNSQSSLFAKVTNQPNSTQSDIHAADFLPFWQKSDAGIGVSNARSFQNNEPSSNERNFIDLNVRLNSESDDDEQTYHPEHRNVEENSNEPYCLRNLSFDVDKISNERLERGHRNVENVLANNRVGHRYTGDIGYDLVPDVVMEQEELSDSEDDVENVEFECEEIDDSEDEIESEQFNGLQNKEISFLPSKEVEIQTTRSRQSRYNKRGSVVKSEKSNADAVKTKRPSSGSSKNKNPPASTGRKRK